MNLFTVFLFLTFSLFASVMSIPNLEHISTGERHTWPHLTGVEADAAVEAIKKDRPDISAVHIVPSNSMVTMDFRTDRVRVFVDKDNKVTREPRVG